MTQVLPVTSNKDLDRFVDFPHDLYKDDVNYVPEIFIGQKDLLSPGKHPFYEHSSSQCFLAFDGNGKITGRIAAIHNMNHNEFVGAKDGFFGFFDCINDQETARFTCLKKQRNGLKKRDLIRFRARQVQQLMMFADFWLMVSICLRLR